MVHASAPAGATCDTPVMPTASSSLAKATPLMLKQAASRTFVVIFPPAARV